MPEPAVSDAHAPSRTVGFIGSGMPVEAILACGATPRRILPGVMTATPLADALIGAGEAADLRATLEPVLAGDLHVALLVVGRAQEWVYYYLKEAVRLGNEHVPLLHLFDFVPSAYSSLQPYNHGQIERLIAAIALATGQVPDAVSWQRAFASGDERRRTMRTLAEARGGGTIAGADAIAAVGAGEATFAATVAALIASGKTRSGPRLLLLSNDIDADSALHRAIEAAGATIVAEDGEWGVRAAAPDADPGDDPVATLAAQLIATAAGPEVSPRAARLGWAEAALARDDIDAVIFAIPPDDRKYGWDYPALRDRAAARGLPQLLLREHPRRDAAAVTSRVAAFLATIDQEAAA